MVFADDHHQRQQDSNQAPLDMKDYDQGDQREHHVPPLQ